MGFQKLADLYEELEQTSSGNKMREILAEFFKKVPEDDIAVISYLTLGQIASAYQGLVLGMAEKSALKAMAKLTVKELFEKLHKITTTTGTGSQEEKVNILVNLLQKASPQGAKYIIRIALGTLRIGAADMTVLDALAIAYTGSKET